MDRLPVEVVSGILENVDTQQDMYQWALVNKLFYSIVNPLLWHSPSIYSTAEGVHPNFTQTLVKCLYVARQHYDGIHHATDLGYHVRRLTFNGYDLLHLVFLLVDQTPMLEEISMLNMYIDPATIGWIFRHCLSLERVYLSDVYSLRKSGLDALARYCRGVRDLTIDNCYNLTPLSLSALKDMPLLERLHISNNRWATNEETAVHLRNLKHLTHLRIFTMPGGEPFDGITNNFIRHFLPRNADDETPFPGLTDFFMGKTTKDPSNRVNNDVLIPFFKTHPCLEKIQLNGGAEINEDTLVAMAAYLPKLQHLDLCYTRGLSSQAIRQLVKACPELKMVDLTGCWLPQRCFPEVPGDELLVNYLGERTTALIRLDEQKLTFSAEDDVLTPSELEDAIAQLIEDEGDEDSDDNDNDDDNDDSEDNGNNEGNGNDNEGNGGE
ncbi:hypothetical protein [Absidia glauca]|uniref:F-box domain-containing protein n=1 Tax=Absidia glauca TaxID=4829 RepID=A0A163JQH2_ABSGL|nr:hypothetical protein [Absidia glauca]